MGRRVTSSTKGGRYMNPADQERKANRKRELKKNKKQRLLVRTTVLKSKDPQQIIEEMEKLDQMEFNANDPAPLSERVMQEKRSKLRETFTRVMFMYRRDNENEKYIEMKKVLQEYDRKRVQMEQHYVAVKFAREVDPGEIPLPDAAPPPPDAAAAMTPMIAALHHIQQQGPFPPHLMMPGGMPFGMPSMGPYIPGKLPAHGILKKKSKSALPPGVPLGIPPELSEDDEEEANEEDEDIADEESSSASKQISVEKQSRVRFDADDDVDEELEKDSRTMYKELAKKIASGERLGANEDGDDEDIEHNDDISDAPPIMNMADRPTQMNSIRPISHVGMGPMSHHHMRPPMPPMGMPPRLRPGMRMPPPPPGFPPGNIQRGPFFGPAHPSMVIASSSGTGAVLSAPPTLTKPTKPVGPIIEAKPQLRNMQHEVTKLIPTSVKVRRETTIGSGSGPTLQNSKHSKGPIVFRTQGHGVTPVQTQTKPKTTDDAYDQFMKEMKGFM